MLCGKPDAEHVTQAVQRSDLSTAFIAYAHAAFCKQEDFEAYYEPLGVASSYLGLRQTIARRYFSGRLNFDAKTILARFVRGNLQGSGYLDSGSDSDAFYGGPGAH